MLVVVDFLCRLVVTCLSHYYYVKNVEFEKFLFSLSTLTSTVSEKSVGTLRTYFSVEATLMFKISIDSLLAH